MTDSSLPTGGLNRYYLTLSSYRIDPRFLDNPRAKIGDGINLYDPLHPTVAPYTAFGPPALLVAAERGLPKSSDIIQETMVLRESLTESEHASVLSAYFKASYMLSSVQGAYQAAKQEQSSHHTIYALLEHSGEAEGPPAEQLRHWRADEVPASESIADPDQALMQFLWTYGSHYVSAMRYGLRIAIQGKLKRESTVKVTEFSTTFKAAFGSFSAEAGVRNQQKQKLEQMAVDLVLEATSGGHSGGLLVARNFEDIAKFLDDVKSDRIQFSVAPIELILNPYWPTLDLKWTRTRAALDPFSATFKTPGAPYGVPKGTIVAWHPTPDYIKGLEADPSKGTIVTPSGWAICDGTQGTPDLRGRFIRGAAEWRPTIASGGSETHTHGGQTEPNTAKRGAHGGAGASYHQPAEAHTHAIQADHHLPPYAEVVYIMKLADVP